ncbi:MAG: HEAT repeat domain-containing protein [Gemmatimonadales bacterium]|nr:MAG: HEAT repeat domain-containing protein [Gemmatimonadales bacterium]
MSSEPGSQALRGLARSIDGLFSREASASPPRGLDGVTKDGGQGDDMTWVAEAAVRLPGDVHRPDPLIDAVKAFARSFPTPSEASRGMLAEAVEDARARRAGPAMAGAVEALAHLSQWDHDTLRVAQDLVTPGVASLLVSRLSEAAGDEGRQAELVEVLPRLGEEVELAVLEALRQEAPDPGADRGIRRSLLEVVAAFADRGSDILARMVREPDWRLARNAIHLVVERGGDDTVEHLTVAMGHSEGRVRRESLQALSRLGGDQAAILATSGLQDPSPEVRAQAARTVGALHAERALRPLLTLLDEEEDPDVVVEVIRALGALGDPSAVIPLEKRAVSGFFSRKPQAVRIAAYRALKAIGTPHAMELIRDALEDRDAEVRRTAQAVLSDDGGGAP